MTSRAALSSKHMATCMLARHHSSRCVTTLPLSCNPLSRRPRCDRNDRQSSSKRNFFYGPPSSWEEEYEELIARRNKTIVMHPLGHGQHILPGNFVVKKHPKTGAEKKVMLEHALGYFWAFKELSLTDNKPIISNETVIPAAEAETFPTLKELVNLYEEVVDIPDFFTRNNRSKDANSQCTLVAISCKEFGARLLPSWIDPFEMALRGNDEDDADRYEVVRITINEGRVAKLLSPFIVSGTKKRVPTADHYNTLMYYGDAEEMRDILRMHNIYTAYVFLLDGIGRVRWAGSGEGSATEVDSMIKIARNLVQPSSTRVAPRQKQASTPRVGKKVPHN
ncbi:hypothetical protein ACHAW5_003547 [Stephanodiscus triporus]|uniref:Mitochondrial ATPase complex subunit ATP10 n=1 Tax=Stephanodiscus triporus TaxID=2934178 RepID=A0ABD3MLV2_9STRA